MRRIACASSLLITALLPSYAYAQEQRVPFVLARADAAHPAGKTEVKPFTAHGSHGSHAAHVMLSKPWFNLTDLPPPNRATNLGTHNYEITSASKEAQAFFNQGLIYAYGFNHLEALRAFRHAQQLDPDCAMCFWGEAYVLGPNLNLPMEAGASSAAHAAAEKAVAKATKASAKEQALAAAILVRYGDGERRELDRKYAEAMQAVAQEFPDDPDIAVLAAESIMLLSPWDYWSDAGRSPKEHTARALQLLEGALAKDASHIAAIHFYIHLVEASDRPQRAEAYADRLRGAVPGAGHLVHMPAHIYLRLGRYKDALEVNRDAVESDERYVAANPGVHGPYRAMYYPHNVHFYMTAALMGGRGEEALTAADKLTRLIPDNLAQVFPIAQPIKQAPYFIQAQFGDPKAILVLPAPSESLPFVVAAWRYARGTAFSLLGEPQKADQEADAIRDLASGDLGALEKAGIPAGGILEVAEHVVRARAGLARGDTAQAKQLAEQAVKAQEKLPYMEPPYWYVPVHQILGAILLKGGSPDEAVTAFKEACAKAPSNVWALYGLMIAEAAAGDNREAAVARQRLDKARVDGAQEPSLDRM